MSARPVSRPNFILITTDQQRADHLGCYGDPVLRTPHIDAIARRGRVFDRCFVASPVCMPNRAAMMTSRMPSAAGVRMNGVPLPLGAVTFAQVLRQAGWRTALIGKGHLQNMTDRPPAGSPSPLRQDEAYSQEAMDQWERSPGRPVNLPYYGFEHVTLCLEHGDTVGGDYRRWLRRQGIDPAQWVGRANALPHQAPPVLDAWRTRLPAQWHPSTFVAQETAAWIDAHLDGPDGQAPFFIHCSFPDPHHPFTPPGEYWDLYDPADVVLPSSCGPAGPGDPPLKRALHEELLRQQRPQGSSRAMAVTPLEARWAIALNYGSLALIDDAIGSLSAHLARRGLGENTVLIFTSDHGDFMGDHGLLNKGPLHYRSLVRVPLIWSDPADGLIGRDDRLCSSIDLGTTVLGRAGLAPAEGMKGLDLMRCEQAGTPPEVSRDAVLIEEETHHRYPASPFPLRLRTLVTDRWRLSVQAEGAWAELYDLQDDPAETVNRWSDPALCAVRADLSMRLVQEMQRQADDLPRPRRIA